ncbi:MAG: hypothetical protein RR336_01070 [Oscillospiraceae bacterium]
MAKYVILFDSPENPHYYAALKFLEQTSEMPVRAVATAVYLRWLKYQGIYRRLRMESIWKETSIDRVRKMEEKEIDPARAFLGSALEARMEVGRPKRKPC